MWEWEIIVEAWPFSTGVGQEEDQKACGPRQVATMWRADDIGSCMKVGDVVSETLLRNPRCHKAPIVSIRRVR